MAKDIQVKVTTTVEDGEVKGLEERIENMKNTGAQVDVDVDDSEVQAADEEIEGLNQNPKVDIDVNNISTIEAIEGVKQGIDGVITSASEAGATIQEMIDVSASFEQNKSFLEMNIGAEKAATAMDDISKIVAEAPGDDLALNSILVASKSKEASLNYQDMTKIAHTAADYMQGMAMLGKNAVEAQQDMRSYIIAGNTAEIERSPILQDHIDKLQAATTPMERQKALAEALKEEGYDGIANQDTMINKQAEFEGALERSKMKLGDMFMPIEAFGMDLFMGLNDATNGIFGALASGIAGLAGPLTNTGLSLAQFGASIKTITGAESVFAGLSGMISGASSSLLTFATGPVGIAIAAIVALGIAVYEVGKYFGWWNDLGSMLDSIRAGVMSLWDAFMSNEYVIQIIDLLKQAFTDVWNVVNEVGSAIMSALFGTGGEFDILGMAIQGLQAILSVVGPVIVAILQGVIWVFQNLYNAAKGVFPYIQQAIITAFSIIIAPIQVGISVFNVLQGVWNSAKATVQNLASTISSALSAANNAWNNFKSTVMGVIQPIMDKINALKDAAAGVAGFFGMGGVEANLVTGFNSGGYSAGVGGTVFNITINGNIDSDARINQLKEDFTAIVNGEITENETVIG